MQFNNKEYTIKIWNGEKLGKLIAIDTETDMVPFTETPALSTFQAYDGGDIVYYVPVNKVFLFLNKHTESSLIAHNFAFDFDVITKHINSDLMYSFYDNDRAFDTGIMYRLLQLAVTGQVPFKYSLQFLAAKFLNVMIEKDERRENFAQFIGKPIEEIPQEYLEYGAIDVIATHQLFLKLEEFISRHDKCGTLLSHNIQLKGDLALKTIYKNGIGFDIPMRDKWLQEKDMELKMLSMRLADWGLIRGVKGYKAQYKYVVEDLLRLPIPYRYKKLRCKQTEQGTWLYDESGMIEVNGNVVRVEEGMSTHGEPSVSSQREDLEEYYDTQPFIKDFLDFMEIEKATSFVRDIESPIIHPRYSLLMTTGRTSCSGGNGACNIQQLPRMGGVRELFIPKKKGNVFIDVDYSSIELAGLAQVCLKEVGYSQMGDLINEGKCLHYHTASSVYGKPESKITKEERQFSKIPNFGFGANMSPKTFIQYCKGYGVQIDLARATEVKSKWLDTYPEMNDYFRLGNDENCYTLTGRKRAKCTYTASLNTRFQGLCADGLKLALYALLKEGYEIVAEIHDQIVIEVEKAKAEVEMPKIEEIMIREMKKVIPDIKVSVEGQIIPRFCK